MSKGSHCPSAGRREFGLLWGEFVLFGQLPDNCFGSSDYFQAATGVQDAACGLLAHLASLRRDGTARLILMQRIWLSARSEPAPPIPFISFQIFFGRRGAKTPAIRIALSNHLGMTRDPNHRTSSTNSNFVASDRGRAASKPADQFFVSRKYGGCSKIFWQSPENIRPFAFLSGTIRP